MPTVVDDDVQLAADLLGPAPEDREVALIARDGLDTLELALRARFFDARGVVFSLPELGVRQELAPYLRGYNGSPGATSSRRPTPLRAFTDAPGP